MHRLLQAAALVLCCCASANAQWAMQDPHVTADLRGIDYVGNGVAWASGSHGTVLRTEDMGFVWQLCATPPDAKDLDFRGVQAFDNNTAIVMSSGPGDESRLYKTTDGCQTWKLVFTNPDKDGFWDAVRFDSEHVRLPSGDSPGYRFGALVGDPVKGKIALFITQDAGDTWWPWRDRQPEAKSGESLFAASNSAVVAPGSDDRFVFVTGGQAGSRVFFEETHGAPFDGEFGLSGYVGFRSVDLPMPKASSAGAFSIARRPSSSSDGADFMVVGGDYKRAGAAGVSVFVPAPTGIRTLRLIGRKVVSANTPPHGYRSAVAYDPKANAWITVGPNGTDISTDDGRNWRPLHPGPGDAPDADKNWNALSLPFVVGPKGRIGILEDAALGRAKKITGATAPPK